MLRRWRWRMRRRLVGLATGLLVSYMLGISWGLPRWAERACDLAGMDPAQVLRDAPGWLWALVSDCRVGDEVVRACWGA